MEKPVLKRLFLACAATVAVALWGCASAPKAPDPVAHSAQTGQVAQPAPTEPSSPWELTEGRRAGADLHLPGLHQSTYPSEGLRPLDVQALGSLSVAALTPPVDIWERIRRGFAMPNLDNDLVHERESWYASRPDYVARMASRGSKYLFYIVEELERRDMPSELALLPFIESAFNPQAVSRAKAAGMWQFMPATGRTFELTQNLFRDDRRDVLASTRAALDYLQKLYGMFGDWQLALAAYNWGEGSVKRAIAKAQAAGKNTGYSDIAMPMETRLYVPKLQAVKNLIATPEAHGITLPDIGNHPYFDTVDIRRDIDVALAAKLAEVSVDDFRALNPGANKPVLLAAGTPQILLPWDNAEHFQANLEAYGGGRLASWTAWIAPTTLKAAAAAQQVGMSEAELRAVNNIPPHMLIKAGSTLLVRRPERLTTDVSDRLADSAQLSLAPEVVLRRTTVKTVKNDTLASLAHRYKVAPAAIAQWNKLGANARLKAGQTLVLYLNAPARSLSTTKTQAARAAAARTTAHAPARVKPVLRTAKR